MKKRNKTQRITEALGAVPDASNAQIAAAVGCTEAMVRHVRKTAFAERLLENGFDGDNWSHGWLKTDTASIFIRNQEGFVTYDQVKDELIREMRRHAPKYPTLKRQKVSGGHLLVVDPADVHIGKLSREGETGAEYGIDTAKRRCLEGVDGLLAKSSGFPIDKVLLVIGNDILHTDNPFRTTTSGTRQDTDGMWWEAFKAAKDLYVTVVEKLVSVADVHVVFCPSNHDFMSGFMLADSLASWFHKAKNVTFDVSMRHRKYVKYGSNMLAFDHGDGCKTYDTKDLMADEEPRMWADTRFRYAYKHHLHHKKKIQWQSGKDYIGLTVEYLRSPSPADGWHHRNGYVSPKAIEGFVHSKDQGQVCRVTHYF